jgi:endonuclease YncB( thermonuclease family)
MAMVACWGSVALAQVGELPPAVQTPVMVWQGRVSWVSDGDTVWVAPLQGDARKVRLLGIDAPEICQPHGPQAKAALETLVLGKVVTVQGRQVDDYGRLLAKIYLTEASHTPNAASPADLDHPGHQGVVPNRSLDVGRWLVQRGHAWAGRFRNASGSYGADEQQARQLGLGLFAQPDVELPRTFRRRHGPCFEPSTR